MNIVSAQAHDLTFKSFDNPNNPIPKEHVAHIDALTSTFVQQREYEAKRAKAGRITERERATIAKAFDDQHQVPKEMKATLEDITAKARERVASLEKPRFDLPFELGTSVFDNIKPVDHSFWWHRWVATWNAPGLSIREANLMEFTGRLNYSNDNYSQYEVGFLSTYGLDANRRPFSRDNVYRSQPAVFMHGTIYGSTGLRWPFLRSLFLGDYWNKCKLVIRNTVYEIRPGTGVVILNQGIAETSIFRMENDYPFGDERYTFPGSVAVPAVDFRPSPGLTTYTDVDVRFLIEIEGDATFEFGPVGLNMLQWRPQVVVL
jgi:hypothetical protein